VWRALAFLLLSLPAWGQSLGPGALNALLPALQPLKSVAIRSSYPHNAAVPTITSGGTFRQYFQIASQGTVWGLSVCYQSISNNIATQIDGTETNGPNSLANATSSIEIGGNVSVPFNLSASNTLLPVYFSGSRNIPALSVAGGEVCSDKLNVQLAPGQGIYIRTYVPPGQTYASSQGLNGNLKEYANSGEFLTIITTMVGDGTTTTFNNTISSTTTASPAGNNIVGALRPGTITIQGNAFIATDDGNGNLTGTTVSSGTINYTTGAFTVTWTSAPTNGQTFTVAGVSRAGTNAPDDTLTPLPSGFVTNGYTGWNPGLITTLAPVAILGYVDQKAATQHTLCIVGDSIVSGVGNNVEDMTYAEYMSHNLGIIRIGQGGEDAATFAVNNFRRFVTITNRCDKILTDYGSNDVTHGYTLAQAEANLLSVWSQLAAILPGGYAAITQQTITPYTISATNNTPISTAWLTERNALNAWICTQVGVTIGAILDTSTILEATPGSCTGTGSGTWANLAYTLDGRHQTNLAQATVMPGVYAPVTGSAPAAVFSP
jgi:hypothetical protein